MNCDSFGIKIKKIRIQQRKTQQDVADYCGIAKSFLSKIEHGKSVPSLGTLSKLAKAFDKNISDLVSTEENEKQWQHDTRETIARKKLWWKAAPRSSPLPTRVSEISG